MKSLSIAIGLLAIAASGDVAVVRSSLEAAWGALSMLLLIAAGTFVSEDLTCITTGLLIGRGELSPATGLLGCFLGIYVGDLGLWAIGRWFMKPAGQWKWVSARLPHERLASMGDWFERRAAAAILISRFVPGSRVLLYLAAGALGRSSRTFMVWTFVAAAIWTPIIVFGSAWLGDVFVAPLQDWLGAGLWLLLPVAVFVMLMLHVLERLATPMGRSQMMASVSKIWRWEFWPAWLFYVPLVPWIAWLSIRHRGFMTITAANPSMPLGGFVGESKSDILRRLPAESVAPFACIEPGDITQRLAMLHAFLARSGATFPIILKPDAGQRGVGVRLARSLADAEHYLSTNPRAVVAQAYHPGPFEAGIFYYRFPGEPRGHIFSITDKVFPRITGDGVSTLEALIWHHPRFRMQATTFLNRHAVERNRVLAAGEPFVLGLAGNHCQGTEFRDGSQLITPDLERAIDVISQHQEGFYFGRFDVRYDNVELFKAGRGFVIIELNGATSESTNIYDPSRSLISAWRTLFRQWSLLFQIGAANCARGHQPGTLMQLLREIRGHYRDRRVSLLAD